MEGRRTNWKADARALKYSNRHEKYIDRLLDIYSKIKWTAKRGVLPKGEVDTNLKLIRDVLICKSYWKISEMVEN